MHYCFFTSGEWAPNAGMVRPRELGKALIELGVTVSYIVDDIPGNRRDLLGAHPSALIHYVFGTGVIGGTLARRQALADLKPDFVHLSIHQFKGFLSLVGSTGIKIVGDWDEWPNRSLPWPRRFANFVRDAWLRNRAAVRVVATHHLLFDFRDRFGLDAVYLPYAKYLKPFPDGPSPFLQPTFVYLGNLWPLWDHGMVLEAFAMLAEAGVRPELILLGGGPDLEKWRNWCSQHGYTHIYLPGFVSGETLWQHLRHAHALLFPMRASEYNLSRCPSKTFAYVQSRRPVITNRVGEIPYLLGAEACYVAPTPQGFAAAVRQFATAPRAADLPDDPAKHTWEDRARTLLAALSGQDSAVTSS